MRKQFAWLLVPVVAFGLVVTKTKASAKKTAKAASVKATAKVVVKVAKKVEKPVTIPNSFLLMFRPIPAVFPSKKNKLTPAKIKLGRMLFYEKRLSKSGKFSCNSCHGLNTYGVDNKQFSDGHNNQKGGRNSPTVYNAALHVSQFWDGRSPDVEDQARHPILNPVEMAAPSEAWVVKFLKGNTGYVAAFKKAYPASKNPITYKNMAKAIGAFERKLSTPSRWDAFLKGNKKALTNKEKRGFLTFFNTGCITCHTGPLLGGHMYQKLGLVKPWPNNKDIGRAAVTKKAYMKFFFKVPSLRNVAKTAPYFHNGSVKSLSKAVSMMAEYQLGRKLTKAQVSDIVAFLKTLTGTLPTAYIKKPKLP